jgi:tetratricopeptide (TPR) repeat protein
MPGHSSQAKSPSDPATGDQRRLALVICLSLAAVTFAVFGQTVGFGFVNYDDNSYIYDNPMVQRGLTLQGMRWALTYGKIGHWHPLTWVSHMADCQVWGLWAGGHHLTNVVLHALAAALLFLALRELTGSLWRSAFVAAVFAVHPLRAESVAWIAERKDVLSGVFFMLTLLAYARYVKRTSPARYVAVAILFALGLMAKNTLVTLPFVLLLLDVWPLRRNAGFWLLVREKIPLFLLSIGSCVATFLVPEKVPDAERLTLAERIGNALVSYAIYLRQMVVPAGLANPYPDPVNGPPLWAVGVSVLVLAAISFAVLAGWKKRPYLLAGWLWYLGMLVPASGIIQISYYAHADRYTYLPGIGPVIAVTWMVADWSLGWKHRQAVLAGLMAAVVGALMICCWRQTGFWRSSETLWTHTLACTSDNYVAHNNLGLAYSQNGKWDEAISEFHASLSIKTNSVQALNGLGNALMQEGRVDQAILQFQQALQVDPGNGETQNNIGLALLQLGKVDEAVSHFEASLQAKPDNASAHLNLGSAMRQKGEWKESISEYEAALQIQPTDVEAQNNLAWLLATCPETSLRNGRKAVELAEKANDLTGRQSPVVLRTLAAALAEAGRFPEAAAAAQEGLEMAETQNNSRLAAQLQSELKLYQSNTPYHSMASPH